MALGDGCEAGGPTAESDMRQHKSAAFREAKRGYTEASPSISSPHNDMGRNAVKKIVSLVFMVAILSVLGCEHHCPDGMCYRYEPVASWEEGDFVRVKLTGEKAMVLGSRIYFPSRTTSCRGAARFRYDCRVSNGFVIDGGGLFAVGATVPQHMAIVVLYDNELEKWLE